MADNKPIGIDAGGYDVMAKGILDLVKDFPGLNGREISFEELNEDGGIAISADNGALILSERRSITDHVRQTCSFPFFFIYRTAGTREFQKLDVNSFLDALGKWICREPVTINGTEYRLTRYPELTGTRKITGVTRSNIYGIEPDDNGVQDWILPVTVNYTNEFDVW